MTCDTMEFFDKEHIFIVVGATNNTEKTGYKVFRDLKESGFNVIGVNKRIGGKEDIVDTPSYDSISSFYERITKFFDEKKKLEAVRKSVVVFVVPPNETVKALHEAIDHGVKKAWFQPGSESEEAIALCKENAIAELHGQCIMVKHP